MPCVHRSTFVPHITMLMSCPGGHVFESWHLLWFHFLIQVKMDSTSRQPQHLLLLDFCSYRKVSHYNAVCLVLIPYYAAIVFQLFLGIVPFLPAVTLSVSIAF
jgi:hypothetical protein